MNRRSGHSPAVALAKGRRWKEIHGRTGAWLAHPRAPLRFALIAMLLCLPALTVGWQLDDYMIRMVMLGRTAYPVAPLEAFSLLRGEAARLSEYIDWGAFPWWTADNLRLALFRFTTVVTHWLDHQLWPESAPMMHLHSLLWLGALVVSVGLLYRRLLGPTLVAGLAGLLYALDEAHGGAAAWLANRNALLAACFGVLGLLAHDHWRRSGRRWGAWAGPLFLALGLASGEMALATVGYLVAYALFLDDAGLRRGSLALAGHGAIIAIWVALYRLGGFGVRGSGLYLDPLGDSLAYLSMLPERLPFLLLGQWTAVSADAGWILPAERARLAWLSGLVTIALLAALLAPVVRHERVARFFAFGMFSSLLPVAATFPSNRLLFFVGIGAMGLAAQLMVAAFGQQSPGVSAVWRIGARVAAVVMIVLHLVIAPVMKPIAAASIRWMGEPTRQAVASLPAGAFITLQDLIVVNTPDYWTFVTLIAVIRACEKVPYPPRVRALSAGPTPITLTRLDPRTLRVELERGLFAGPLSELLRSRHDPLPVGSKVQLTGMQVTVTAVDETGGPVEFEYRFEVPLEDRSLHWVRWEDGVYVPMELPAMGESVSLPAPEGPFEKMTDLFPIF